MRGDIFMKKLLAGLLAGIMLIASMPMAMAADPTNLKELVDYLSAEGIHAEVGPVEAPVEIKVKKSDDSDIAYQDDLIYTRTGSETKVDFTADLDMSTVKNAFDNYMLFAEMAIENYGSTYYDALMEKLGNTKVDGEFKVKVTLPNDITLPENALTTQTDVYFEGEAYDDLFEEVLPRTQQGNIITFTVKVNGTREANWAYRDELAESLEKELKLVCKNIGIPDVAGVYEFKGVFDGNTDIYSDADMLGNVTYYSADEDEDNYADVATITVTEPSSPGGGGVSVAKGYIEITNTVKAPDDAIEEDYAIAYDIMQLVDGQYVKVRSVTVKPGETERVVLDEGTYYVLQHDENLIGYMLQVTCSDTDNHVEVKRGGTSKIEFENVYTSKETMLEKEDHFAYIVGYPDGTVRPEANITRAEVATIFFRMMTDEAREEYYMDTNSFNDVSSQSWYNIAISTLQKAQVINGYSDGGFHPNAPITRAELSKIALSFYKMKESNEVNFSDISGHWAEIYIKSAYAYGFISGYPDGTFRPDQPISRAETMRIVNRALNRIPHKDHLLDGMREWVDNMNKGAWYYADVQEATNSHNYTRTEEYGIWTELRPNRNWSALEKVTK